MEIGRSIARNVGKPLCLPARNEDIDSPGPKGPCQYFAFRVSVSHDSPWKPPYMVMCHFPETLLDVWAQSWGLVPKPGMTVPCMATELPGGSSVAPLCSRKVWGAPVNVASSSVWHLLLGEIKCSGAFVTLGLLEISRT